MKYMFYVYLYIDPSRDEVFYIGKGRGSRSKSHKWRKDKHPLTQRLQFMKKRNIQPIIEKYENLVEDGAFRLEKILIKFYGRKDLGLGSLLNLTDGGEGWSGRTHTEEWKLNHSEDMKGNSYAKGNLGVSKSENACRNMSNAQLNRLDWHRTRMQGNSYSKGIHITCPHCGKTGGSIMKRWHFDNCKVIKNVI